MNTAKQWVEGWNQCADFNDETWIELQAKDLIEAVEHIQADALRWAAEQTFSEKVLDKANQLAPNTSASAG